MSNSAGFYSNHWGYLPWAWGRGPRDKVELFKVWGKEKPTPEETEGKRIRVLD